MTGHDAGLWGTAEAAAWLGVSRQRVLQLAARDDFPEPLAVLTMGKVWRAGDVRAWAARHRPPPPDGTTGHSPGPS